MSQELDWAIQAFVDVVRAEDVLARRQGKLQQMLANVPQSEIAEYMQVTERITHDRAERVIARD